MALSQLRTASSTSRNLFNFDTRLIFLSTGVTYKLNNPNNISAWYSGVAHTYTCVVVNYPVQPNTQYTLSLFLDNTTNTGCDVKTLSGGYLTGAGFSPATQGNLSFASCTFNSGSNTQLKFSFYTTMATAATSGHCAFSNVQLELGSVPTPFVAYQPNLPAPTRAPQTSNSGMYFNGVLGNYIQTNASYPLAQNAHAYVDFMCSSIPSQTGMMIDQYGVGYGIAIFVNNSGGLGFRYGNQLSFNTSNVNYCDGNIHRAEIIVSNGLAAAYLDGVLLAHASNADGQSNNLPVNIGMRTAGSNQYPFQGVIYRVFLTDGVRNLINFDFTNPASVVGSTVFQGTPQNLVPTMDTWGTAPGYTVLGKDSVHLNASSSSLYLFSSPYLFLSKNTNYLLMASYGVNFTMNGNYRVRVLNAADSSFLQTVGADVPNGRTFNSGFVSKVYVRLENFNQTIGIYDFFKLTLIALTGHEGTINGSPKLLNSQQQRTLYSLR